MANKSGKKQGGKTKSTSSKKTTIKVNAGKKATTKKTPNKKAASKKPVEKKTTEKKPVEKKSVEKKPVEKKPVEKKTTAKKTTKKPADFSEFETFKLGEVTKLDSKIILRDVEKERPFSQFQSTTHVEKKPEPKPEPVIEQQPVVKPQPIIRPVVRPVARPVAPKPTAKDIKEQEIAKAIKNAAKLPAPNPAHRKKRGVGEFRVKRVILATACITTAIFAIVYFVNLASTDMSLKVAAMQSGIDASYPSYVPRGFNLSDVTSGTGKVTMHFKSGDEVFGLTEENSKWDSEALLNNYIKPNYGNEYSVIREQGLTLYMGEDWEAWVSGGILYKLTVDSGSLTKKQMKSIATSL